MIDRLDSPQSVRDTPVRPLSKENANRGDFEQTLNELEERDRRTMQGSLADSECESPAGEGPTTKRSHGEGAATEMEALLLPWQLIPQAALSQLMRSAAGADQIAGARPDAAIAMPLADNADVRLYGQAPLPTAMHHDDGRSPIAQPWCAARDAVRKSEEAGSSRLPMAGLANPWSERLVRWTSGPGQRMTAWVRDYGLEDTDMPALIHDLLKHASGQGVQLARIVVNGQERWNAEKTPITEPR